MILSNLLLHESSPYLLQHADNPVNWYPWCSEAFRRAKEEDKPIFLSIGYSTCHWCHVMAHESFEDEEVARLLNQHFISIKVDKEERPDIDSIYMAVCQAFTGSGGWPTTVFMTAEQKPFFAGTYYPKHSRGVMIGLCELLALIHRKWENDRAALLRRADEVLSQLTPHHTARNSSAPALPETAVSLFKQSFDDIHGGFGSAPKFPTAHNLLFLLSYYERYHDGDCLDMAEQTLLQMYRGGLFDHIGGGFCRYSTDERFLVPHFEKMLYDNALLIMAYGKAYALTKRPLYLSIAEKTASYILREMTDPTGGFYSAQDADSDGQEGRYYLFTPSEITTVLGKEDGGSFNRHYDITPAGHFEGKSIPNLLHSDPGERSFEQFLPQIYQYRKKRAILHKDDKILTAWNSLMIAAMCRLYRLGGDSRYLAAARRADGFIQDKLYEKGILYVSWRDGHRGVRGFLDDYAMYIYAQLALYTATLEQCYLDRAEHLCRHVLGVFADELDGGFYLYGEENETLILRPKEAYDGAIPSGNSFMAWVLVRLAQLTGQEGYQREAQRQLDFLASEAARYPAGYTMFLLALLDNDVPPPKLTIVLSEPSAVNTLPPIPPDMVATVLTEEAESYPLINGQTTYYLCRGQRCLPPVNDLNECL